MKTKLRKCNERKFCKNCGIIQFIVFNGKEGKCRKCGNKLYSVVNKK